ncbi:MAG: GTP-binding protein [Xanthobacteraceae bacterium]|nr:GTP-binding protein [Xanthobacteraceae bacterium]
MSHTPVTILTGFLGSGKTTLLNRALRDPAMANTAVVINEFGEVGLDHVLAAQSDDTIMVLENGCLCCTVFGDLVTTLNNLYHQREDGAVPRFDHVVIETSGLADPSPLIQAFLSDPTLAGLYRIGMVVATVDAVNGPATLDEHIESVRQVALADHILITKLDLVAPEKAKAAEAALTARLHRLNPAAKITRIYDPVFDIGKVLRADALKPGDAKSDARAWLNAAAYMEQDAHAHGHEHHDGEEDHDHHHLHDRDIASFCFVREQPITREALRLLLDALQQNLGPNLLRVKGIVNVAEEPDRPAVIQGAQQLLHNLTWLERWPDADRRSKIVFITQGFDRAEVEDMIAVLDRVATRTAAARARAQAQTIG